jgi:predicted RNA-binding Zn-ribbon protein involved in translation (DUF1610 family)
MADPRISSQKRLGEKNPADGSGKVACPGCQVVMSRRALKKPDSETGLIEATYRCPKCGAIARLWVRD